MTAPSPSATNPVPVGYLVGEHKGLFTMFHAMNEARIGVRFLATCNPVTPATPVAGYAKTRVQGRPVDAEGPASKPVAIIEHPDVKRMLLAQKSYVGGGLALGLWSSTLVDRAATATDDDERARAALLLDVITDQQELAVAVVPDRQRSGDPGARRLQVPKEFDVEQCYRDNRLNPIHEGTHGVQAIDLLGLQVHDEGGAGLQGAGRDHHRDHRASHRRPVAMPAGYAATARPVDRIPATVMAAWAAGDPAVALANATAFLEATGHTVLAWLWLEQFLAAEGKEGDFYDGKRAATQYFFRYELPNTGPMFDLVAAGPGTTLDASPDWF